jgi:hypothetical protein
VIDISAFQLLLTLLTGWLDREERDVLRYLLEENRVLRRQLRGRRIDNPSFLAYVEQILVPRLRPGDIVVLDNLAVPGGPCTWRPWTDSRQSRAFATRRECAAHPRADWPETSYESGGQVNGTLRGGRHCCTNAGPTSGPVPCDTVPRFIPRGSVDRRVGN